MESGDQGTKLDLMVLASYTASVSSSVKCNSLTGCRADEMRWAQDLSHCIIRPKISRAALTCVPKA